MYYVRKLSKPSNLQKVKTATDLGTIPADFIGQEMRTSDNTLSVWRCESIDKDGIADAIKAALFVSSDICATQFIILDSDMLNKAGIKICDTEGSTAYRGLNHLHTDLCELTYEKLGTLLDLYQKTSQLANRTPKIEKEQFQKIALNALQDNCLDESKLTDHFKKGLNRLADNSKLS